LAIFAKKLAGPRLPGLIHFFLERISFAGV